MPQFPAPGLLKDASYCWVLTPIGTPWSHIWVPGWGRHIHVVQAGVGGCWRRVDDEGGSPLGGAVLLLFSWQNLRTSKAANLRGGGRGKDNHFILRFTEWYKSCWAGRAGLFVQLCLLRRWQKLDKSLCLSHHVNSHCEAPGNSKKSDNLCVFLNVSIFTVEEKSWKKFS